jgi:Fic family protein
MLKGVSNLKIYNPTAPDEIFPTMTDIATYLSKNELTDVLCKTALAHYQFETIHPFEHYNGIVGRILITMTLNSLVLSVPWIITLSEFLYKNKNDYFDIISSTQHSGGYIRWIKFLLLCIQQAASQAIIRLDKYEKIIKRDEAIIISKEIFTKNDVRVFNYFKRHLVSKIKPISEELDVSFNTVSKSVNALLEIGILRMENDQSRHRIFQYNDALDIFN